MGVQSLFLIAFLSERGMELLRTQLRIQSPEIFLILEAKRKLNNNAELSNTFVKTCSKRQNYCI